MTTGKPQQAADTSPDDLIAELARLMANDAKDKPAAESPAAPPVTPAAVPRFGIPAAAAPVAPAAAVEPEAPEVRIPGGFRIPGMNEPARPAVAAEPARVEPNFDAAPKVSSPMPAFAHLSTPSPQASKPSAPPLTNFSALQPVKKDAPTNSVIGEPFKFDFGVINPAPVGEAARPAEPEPTPVVPAPQAAAIRIPGGSFQPAAPEEEPKTEEARPQAQSDHGEARDEHAESAPVSAAPAEPAAPADEFDPIADLIAAELDASPKPQASEPAGGFVLRPAPAPAPRAVTTPVAMRQATPAASPGAPSVQNPFVPSRLQPQSRPQPAQDENYFAMAPANPAASEKSALDPIDEIEDLIGRAVAVELNAPKRAPALDAAQPAASAAPSTRPLPAAPAHSPVVPPLNTGFAPRRAGIKEKLSDDEVHAAAEAAILAAAAATGAEVGRVREPSLTADIRPTADARPGKPAKAARPTSLRSEPREDKAPRAAPNMKPLVGLAVAGTLLLLAGFGLYWVLGMGNGGGDTNAPVLTADQTPTKEAAPPAAATDAQNSVVMNQIDGVQTSDSEQLVSRDQSTDTPVAETADGDATEAGLTNRKVRTVTVRPDGTIVSSDDTVAGATQLPVDRPNVPALPEATLNGSDLLSGEGGQAATDPIAATIAAVDQTGATPVTAVIPGTQTATTALPEGAVMNPNLVAPLPAARIVNREAALALQAPAQPTAAVAATTDTLGQSSDPQVTASAQQPVAAVSGGDAPAYVQVSSQRSEADAQTQAQSAANRFGSLFGGRQLVIRRADLGAKGVFYRVWLPANSLQEASQICASIKANGGDCFPVSP